MLLHKFQSTHCFFFLHYFLLISFTLQGAEMIVLISCLEKCALCYDVCGKSKVSLANLLNCSLVHQTVMRRRDNIQSEFEAKNEALMSRKTDQEVVSVSHPFMQTQAHTLNPPVTDHLSLWRNNRPCAGSSKPPCLCAEFVFSVAEIRAASYI